MAVKRDRFHKKAAIYYRKLSKAKVRLVTSNYVLAETYTRIRFDDGHAKALQFNALIQGAIKAGRLNLEWVSAFSSTKPKLSYNSDTVTSRARLHIEYFCVCNTCGTYDICPKQE